MTPDQFLRSLAHRAPAPLYLFIGPEIYRRRECRDVLVAKVLPPGAREDGFVRHDLEELTLAEVIDDARSMSLFAGERLLWVAGAEAALPRGRAVAAEDDSSAAKDTAGAEILAAYCKNPTPGVVIVFDSARWDFEGEDKARLERLVRFYAAVADVVEFPRFTASDARAFAQAAASRSGLQFGQAELDLLVEATAADPSRIAVELDKLALYTGSRGGVVRAEDIQALVPDAQETTIFALVNALARRDQAASLALLDTLVRAGEYLPLALTFLGGIFRMALAAREQNLRSAAEVQSYFQRHGMPMWPSRAQQVYAAGSKFTRDKLAEAIELVFRADRDLKSIRADDRLVMEDFVLRLTRYRHR